jgi:ribokinase
MRVLNFGSLNIDYVYTVEHIVTGGETISSSGYAQFAGGKGANQSVAMAKAGCDVYHAGKIGRDGAWLLDKLKSCGVRTNHISIIDSPSGHAIIQVDRTGQNAIVLFPGANTTFNRTEINHIINQFGNDTILVLQNEINEIAFIIETAHRQGMRICFNPSPFDNSVNNYLLHLIDILILNETEARGLSQMTDPADSLVALRRLLPQAQIILTLGSKGAMYRFGEQELIVPAYPTEAIDTTAAGDTFVGFFIAAKAQGQSIEKCLRHASKAASISVSRKGAMDSIPVASEL